MCYPGFLYISVKCSRCVVQLCVGRCQRLTYKCAAFATKIRKTAQKLKLQHVLMCVAQHYQVEQIFPKGHVLWLMADSIQRSHSADVDSNPIFYTKSTSSIYIFLFFNTKSHKKPVVCIQCAVYQLYINSVITRYTLGVNFKTFCYTLSVNEKIVWVNATRTKALKL